MTEISGKTVQEIEENVLKFWKKEKIYDKLKNSRKNGKNFFFLDGPPYATGNIHMGNVLNYSLKDCYRRFFWMRGFDVWSQPGFDTHGVPIENKVEKKLGFKTKKDIESFGVEKFVNECKNFAIRYAKLMSQQFEEIGVWMDWECPYLTLDNDYIEGAWFTFKKGFEKKLLYKDNYPVHVCPHCETAVAYNEIVHQKVRDPSIYLKFPVKGKPNEYFLVWTTTPWTIPANTAIMANPEAEYVKVKAGNEYYILSNRLLAGVMKKAKIEEYKIVESYKGKQLEGMHYIHPLKGLPLQKNLKNAHRIVLSEQYVTLEDGTGLVHTAPGHGQEDYKIGIENKLPILSPVDMSGKFTKDAGEFSGLYVRDANEKILEKLREKNLVLHEDKVDHEYPFCWRCDTALILISVPQWFFKITDIRDALLKENEKIKWSPGWAGDRFKNWLENLGDWPVSRQRYWGIPLPIWVCENCESIKVVGSRKELPKVPKDFHKPHIDKIFLKCQKCKSKMRRVSDVMDVWFDSGVAPWASLGYPRDEKTFKKLWPADLVLEGSDQIRGWWNSLLITSVMTFGRRSFENVIFHGFVLDEHGVKMSKSRGNVVDPQEVIKKYGRDIMRFYFLSQVPADDSFFKWNEIEEIFKSMIVIRNTFNFIKTYVKSVGSPSGLKIEDKWILSKLNSLIESCTKNFDSFNAHRSLRDLTDFILNDFSRWYIKLIRDRVWTNYRGADKKSAFYILYTVAKECLKLLSPFVPFFAETSYQNIILPLKKDLESIHLHKWPAANKKSIDKNLEKQMKIAKEIFEASQNARQQAGIKLRWPVKSVVVVSDSEEVRKSAKSLKEILENICNTKLILSAKEIPAGNFAEAGFSHGKVFVNKEMDGWVLNEAMFREVVRAVQDLRKKNKFHVEQNIRLSLKSDNETEKILKGYRKKIMQEVGATDLAFGKAEGKFKGSLEFREKKIEIAFAEK